MAGTACPFPGCTWVVPDSRDAMAVVLLSTHSMGHSPTPGRPSTKLEPVKRPVISLEGTAEEWGYFLNRWEEYTTATKATGVDRVLQLLECCDTPLRLAISRQAGKSMVGYTEDEAMAAIKSLAVRAENIEVSVDALLAMHQDRDELVRSFATRVKGQASTCQFTEDCTCGLKVNFSERMQRHVIIRGLADKQIRREMMGDTNPDKSLKRLISSVEGKEAGNRADSRCARPDSSEHTEDRVDAGSSYRKQNRQQPPPPVPVRRQRTPSALPSSRHAGTECFNCGGSHDRADMKANCPAHGTICSRCSKPNHFAKVCRGANPSRPATGRKPHTENAISHSEHIPPTKPNGHDSVCVISHSSTCTTTDPRPGVGILDHHIFDQDTGSWTKRESKPQPYVTLLARTNKEDYRLLGRSLAKEGEASIEAMADTGCQSCLMSLDLAERLGLRKHDLLRVRMKMNAANNVDIPLVGAAIIRLTHRGNTSGERTTRQMVYITTTARKLFLSQEACTDLGLIPSNFPLTSCAGGTSTGPHPTPELEPRTCSCPKRAMPPPILTDLPFPGTEANRGKLEAFLLERYAASTFNICEHQALPMMTGPPMRLLIDKNATPTAVHTPTAVPLFWQESVKAGLERDVRLGVLERVDMNTPVTWCHRMVICAKNDGSPRRTVDFQPLNKHATRDTHHTMSPFHQARSVPPNSKKTVTDAWNGYHSVPLHEDDRHYTAFITPWGQFRYKTAPQGYIASGDGYTRRFDEIMADIHQKTQCIDDTLLWSDSIEESFHQAIKWLDRCANNGITLHPKKFHFGKDCVDFAGFTITSSEVKPGTKFHSAISDFPVPKTITDIRSWFGLVNQISYAFSMADSMLPFRELLKQDTKFLWTPRLQAALDASKSHIVEQIKKGVTIFDKTLPTCLATDWSKEGIGYWLFQKHCQCPTSKLFCCKSGWKVAMVGSRFTHSAESRYAPIEGEALAVVDALQKARHFVLGCRDLIVAVDHKPLLKVFGDRSLEQISNGRLRNLKEKTLRFRFSMVHIPGVRNAVSDSLSRHPTGDTSPAKMPLEDMDTISQTTRTIGIPSRLIAGVTTSEEVETEVERAVEASLCGAIKASSITRWTDVQEATSSDPDLMALMDFIESGFPKLAKLMPPTLQEYHPIRQHLMVCNGVIAYKGRLLIPQPLRDACLLALHAAHQGTSAMIAKAEQSIFWPGITRCITNTRAQCRSCNQMAPSQAKLPPTPPVLSTYPFQHLCADYFSYMGHHYLVIVDRYSGWPIVSLPKGGAQSLVDQLRITFSTFGIPEELASDGGPEFTASITQRFLKDWGVNHRLSSVAFPHSNCRAEIGVKSMKRLITGNVSGDGSLDRDSFQRAVLAHRNTPNPQTKMSPAMCIFGHQTRDLIPVLPFNYIPHKTWYDNVTKREEALRHRHARALETWSEHSRQLPPLKVGDHVLVQNQTGNFPTKWDRSGVVIEVRQHHQYVIRIDGAGRVTLRNRQFLRRFTPHTAAPPPEQLRLPIDPTRINHQPPEDTPKPQGASPPRPTTPPVQETTHPTFPPPDTASPDEEHDDPPPPDTASPDEEHDDQSTCHVAAPPTDPPPAAAPPRSSGRHRSLPKWHESYLF